MDESVKKNPVTVEGVFNDFKCRRTALIKALTTDVKNFHQMFDPEKQDLRLYGFPDEHWEVNSDLEVPSEIPEPTTGLNFYRDRMLEKDWLSLIADYSDVWVLSLAFFFGAHYGFKKADRGRLFDMISDLPTIYEVVRSAANKREKEKEMEKSSFPYHSDSKKTGFARHMKYYKWLLEKNGYNEGIEQKDGADDTCGACGEKYGPDEFWIFCDFCEKWFHGMCVHITQESAEHIDEYKCPACTNKKATTNCS